LEQIGKPSWWPNNPFPEQSLQNACWALASAEIWLAVRMYLDSFADFIPEEEDK